VEQHSRRRTDGCGGARWLERSGNARATNVEDVADLRSDALVENFAAQWLTLRDLDRKAPDPRLFPDFDESLHERCAENRSLRRDIVRENRSVLDFLTATDNVVNERLAKFYGFRTSTATTSGASR
jgi:hypothetical protein